MNSKLAMKLHWWPLHIQCVMFWFASLEFRRALRRWFIRLPWPVKKSHKEKWAVRLWLLIWHASCWAPCDCSVTHPGALPCAEKAKVPAWGWWSSGGDIDTSDALACPIEDLIDSDIMILWDTKEKHCQLSYDTGPCESCARCMNRPCWSSPAGHCFYFFWGIWWFLWPLAVLLGLCQAVLLHRA